MCLACKHALGHNQLQSTDTWTLGHDHLQSPVHTCINLCTYTRINFYRRNKSVVRAMAITGTKQSDWKETRVHSFPQTLSRQLPKQTVELERTRVFMSWQTCPFVAVRALSRQLTIAKTNSHIGKSACLRFLAGREGSAKKGFLPNEQSSFGKGAVVEMAIARTKLKLERDTCPVVSMQASSRPVPEQTVKFEISSFLCGL